MSAATSPGTGLAYGLRRVCAALGHGPLLGSTPTSGTEARDLGPGAAGGDRSRPGGIGLGGRGLPQGLGSASCRDIRVARKRVLRLMRENNLPRPIAAAAVADPHDGEIITHAPNLMWGTDGVRVFTERRLGRSSPPSSIGTPSVSAGMSASAARSRSPWGLPGCMARPRPARLGGWPCGWITAPSIWDHFTNRLGIQSYAFVRAVQSPLKERSSMVASTAELHAVRDELYNAAVDRET